MGGGGGATAFLLFPKFYFEADPHRREGLRAKYIYCC